MVKDQKPFFSIGIPTYNRKELLKESIDSCLWQTFTDFEVIVANDYPPEPLDPAQLGANDPRLRIVNHPRNLGALANMNFLIDQAHGKYFVWLSDDDMFMPDFLKKVHAALDRYSHVSCVYTSYVMAEEYPKDLKIGAQDDGRLFEGKEFLKAYIKRHYEILGWYGIFETQFFKRLGGYEQLGSSWISPYSDLLIPIKAASMTPVIVIDLPLIFFRVHKGSISATSKDFEAYSSSQIAFLEISQHILRSGDLAESFQDNLYHLLKRFVSDYLEVSRRFGKLQPAVVMKYFKDLEVYRKQLDKNYFRYWGMVFMSFIILFKNMAMLKIKGKRQ